MPDQHSFISIRNGVIASVIAGVILLAIPSLRGVAMELLSSIWNWLLRLGELLTQSYAFPGWFLVLLFGISTLAILTALALALDAITASEYEHYTEDHLYGAKWRWTWKGKQPHDPWCFCPRCDGTLIYQHIQDGFSFHADITQTNFICEHCNNQVIASIDGGHKHYALGVIKREIDRRVRTGDYPKKKPKA